MLAVRILTGVVAVPLLMLMALDRGWWFLLGVYATALAGTAEALWMARQAGHRPLSAFGFLVAIGILADATFSPEASIGRSLGLPQVDRFLGLGIGSLVLMSLAALLWRADFRGSLTDWALTIALPLYVAGLVQFFIPLRERQDGGLLTWPVMVLTTSWACDSAAYFAGRAFGRVKLAAAISPVKSREGALAGLAAATFVGTLYSAVTDLDPLRMAGFGLAVGLGSVIGDLVESLIKRQCGVKDSGFLMPGHGGILDRMDALIFAAGSAFFYLRAVA